MIEDLSTLFVLVFIVPMVVGYAIRSPNPFKIRFRTGLSSATYSIMLGMSLTVVMLVSISWVVSISVGAWIVLSSLSILVFVRYRAISELICNDLRNIALSDECRQLICIALVVLFVLCMPIISHGILTSVEGTGNHDSLHYIATSSWLIGNKFNSLLAPDQIHPWSYMARLSVQLGQEHGIPRIGAEILLSYVSVILGKDPFELFSILFSYLGLYWVMICWLIVDESFAEQDLETIFLSKVLTSFSPVMFFMVSNSNYPTMLGCTFLTFVIHSMVSGSNNEKLYVPVLCLSALASTYPELLMPLALITLCNVLYRADNEGMSPAYNQAKYALKILMWGILTMPWIWLAAGEVIISIAKISATQGKGIPSMFEGLGVWQEIISFLVLDRYVSTHLGAEASLLIVFCILAALITTFRSCSTGLVISIYIALSVEVLYVWHAGFNYGKFKVAEFFSTYITVFLSMGVALNLKETYKWLYRYICRNQKIANNGR